MSAELARTSPLRITPTGWTPGTDVSEADWRRYGQRFALMERASRWLLGDWLNYGEATYGQKYIEAVAITGLEVGTLMNLAYVASRFGMSRRREELSWSHHYEVASLDGPEADRLLEQASEQGWSRNRLRTEVRARKGPEELRDPHDAEDPSPAKAQPPRATLTVEPAPGLILTLPVNSAAEARREFARRVDVLRKHAEELGFHVQVTDA